MEVSMTVTVPIIKQMEAAATAVSTVSPSCAEIIRKSVRKMLDDAHEIKRLQKFETDYTQLMSCVKKTARRRGEHSHVSAMRILGGG